MVRLGLGPVGWQGAERRDAVTHLRMTVDEWYTYHTHLGERMHRAAVAGLRTASIRIIALLIERTRNAAAASPNGARGAIDTGAFLRAWHAVPDGMGLRVYNDRPYAGVIEYGRRPGSRPPPSDNIRAWLISRHGLSASRATALAWVVAQSIGRRGLQGRRILTAPEANAQIRDIVETSINAEIDKEIGKKR